MFFCSFPSSCSEQSTMVVKVVTLSMHALMSGRWTPASVCSLPTTHLEALMMTSVAIVKARDVKGRLNRNKGTVCCLLWKLAPSKQGWFAKLGSEGFRSGYTQCRLKNKWVYSTYCTTPLSFWAVLCFCIFKSHQNYKFPASASSSAAELPGPFINAHLIKIWAAKFCCYLWLRLVLIRKELND